MNKKTVAVDALVAILILSAFLQLIIPQVHAVNVEITSVSPKTGKVGDTVSLVGKINTTNGEYLVFLGSVHVASGTASGNNVNCTFRVPSLPTGNYTLALHDITANANATSWFYIETGYIVKVAKPPYPRQFQEGETAITISTNITGGRTNTVYAANITVKTPANETYWSLVHLNTTSTGEATASLKYPENFVGGAHTNYAGTYLVSFNGTLASDTFFIGLTDQAEYHRGDTIKIRAVNYSPFNGENVTITITFENKTVDRFNCTVLNGIVEANWTVPNHVLVGNYRISITPKPGTKKVSDFQIFAVPGFRTEIIPRNLAGEPVPNVLIRVFDRWANVTYNVTSNADGVSTIELERGEYESLAYFKKVRVGESSFTIQESGKLNLTCRLTNLEIKVVSEGGNLLKIPFVALNLSITYSTNLDGGKTEKETIVSQTSVDGSVQLKSLIVNASYKIAASRYGRVFNPSNDTISELKPIGWNHVTIICPIKPLQISVVDAKDAPISNALVEIQETMGGIRYTSYTNQNGQVTFNCVIGVYLIKVHSGGVLLNATTTELFEEKNLTLRCCLYSLPICIKVVDYFGQPIPNVDVILERNGVQISSKRTESDGIASFMETGGTLTIKVYLTGQNQPALTLTCSILEARDETNPIVVKVGRYVFLAGFLLETAWFATIFLIVILAAIFLAIEVLKLRKHR